MARGSSSTAVDRSRSWIEGRWAQRIDVVPFIPARVWRFLTGHHWARVDLTLPAIEADIAAAALERRGWRRVAVGDGDPKTLVFVVRVGRGGGQARRMATELTVALADARVRSIERCVVDPEPPKYEPLQEWRTPLPKLSSGLRGERTQVTRARLFTPMEQPERVLASHALHDSPTSTLERVGTASDRVRAGVVALRTMTQEEPGGIALTSVAGAILIATLVTTQAWWPGPRAPAGGQSYLWLHERRLGAVLLAGALLAGAAGLATAAAPHRFKWAPRATALVLGAAVLGGVVGGWTRLEVSWGAFLGVVLLGVVAWLWRQARFVRVQVLKHALRLTSLAGVAGLVALFGRGRAWTYFAAMEVPPADVDMSAAHSFALAAKPAGAALLTLALLLAVSWMVSGHGPSFVGAAMTLVACAAAASLLVRPLSADQRRGRLVGTGLARFTADDVAFDPGPKPMCLASLDPEPAKALPSPLPMLVWELGRAGPYTMLLDPAAARRSYPDMPTDPAERATHLPAHDVQAPVWYVPTGQFTLRGPVGLRCDP